MSEHDTAADPSAKAEALADKPVPDQPGPPAKAKRKRRRGRFGLWLLLSLVFLTAILGFGALALTGKPIRLPVWAVAEVEIAAEPGG